MKIFLKTMVLAAICLPLTATAHKQWLAPSKTVLNVGQWVTFDAGVSTDPFVRDNNAARVENLVITAPDGSVVLPENSATGKLRATFDLQLQQAGTYKVAIVNSSVGASWDDNGQTKRWPARGTTFTAEGFAKEVPANAKDLKVTQSIGRIETFVTAGKPNTTALKPTGKGLELVQVTGFNDLYSGEPATFQFLLDGKPAADVEVEAIADGTRYRNAINEIELKTDKDGRFTINWSQPGLYYLSASVSDDKAEKPATQRRSSYTATFEVLSP
ncbi:DUF4198 domain-containing protein [Stenotrophobium rhamnosiphilum]|uniref:DUF4198 domain-containing protein n=1 Tax=Stenotrophobium rhamnosiphilum TaxID=2029166 RepID=A0A2T5MKU8_9GAMM|nr:DUF4198 domain-containing protein [Stenotrophobium rhamnosiphilum]PTU33195.1 DUF4198 domain-containing protein [Stenotrophobium rhamnosiphilum]